MKSINYGPIFKFLFLLFILTGYFSLRAQDSLRVMSYNLLMYPDGVSYNREPYLQQIIADYQPDIFAVCEIHTRAGADDILSRVLQNIRSTYSKARFEYNHSYGGDLQQFIYFDSAKVHLHSQTYLQTNVRDINHYVFYLKTAELASGDTIFIDYYVAHLKASSGTSNEQTRLNMVNVFTQDLNNIPPDHYVIFSGDLNIYHNNEPAYQELLDPTNAIVMKDPINAPGYWHNNSSFAYTHTQSTHRNNNPPYDNFVGGGLDDRFDFILLSENFFQTGNLQYRQGSYFAYGNNGNCFNKNINDTSCTGRFSQSLRDNLFEMSDHLPVVCTLETLHHFSVEKQQLASLKLYPNPADDYIMLPKECRGKSFEILDMQGHILYEIINYDGKKFYLHRLKPGIYYVVSRDKSYAPSAFIKR